MIHTHIPNLILQENFELYWDPARDLIIDKQTIGFQVIHKDKLRIMFKYAGDGFQAYDVCDHGHMKYFIYHNGDIPD